MATIFLTHPESTRRLFYREAAVDGLRQLGTLRLNPHDRPLTMAELAEMAADSDVVVSDPRTPGEGALFDAMPGLVAFVRCAVDIRNVDVAGASRNGVLVTRAGPGFGPAVAEWIVGAMIGLARGTVEYAVAYRTGGDLTHRMGREIRGSTVGIIGYGTIAKRVCRLLAPFEARILVHDPMPRSTTRPSPRWTWPPWWPRRISWCRWPSPRPRPRTWSGRNCCGDEADRAAGERIARQPDGRGRGRRRPGRRTDCRAGHGCRPCRGPDAHAGPGPAPGRAGHPHIGGLTPEASAYQAMETVRQVADIVRGIARPAR